MAFISTVMVMLACLALAAGIGVSVIGIILLIIYFVKKKKSKGFLISSVILLIIGIPMALLSSAFFIYNGVHSSVLNTIEINDVTYQTGFYGDLFPVNIMRTDEEYIVHDRNVYHINYKKFDLMQYDNGTTNYGDTGVNGGQIYCNKEQWKEAKAFYEAPESFVIKYKIGADSKNYEPIEGFDYKVFEELYSFSQKQEYSPVRNQEHNKDVVRFSSDDFNRFYENELTIYKESIDGLFCSTRANKYQIIEGRLYLLIHYISANDDNEGDELECVPVPEELGEYVIQTVSALNK